MMKQLLFAAVLALASALSVSAQDTNMTFSTDANMFSRRGYGSSALNTDDFVVNASISTTCDFPERAEKRYQILLKDRTRLSSSCVK